MEVDLALSEFQKLKDHLNKILKDYSSESIERDYELPDRLKPSAQLLLSNFYGGTQEHAKFYTELNMATRIRVVGTTVDRVHDLINWVDLVLHDLELKKRILDQQNIRAKKQHQSVSKENSKEAGSPPYLKPLMVIVFLSLSYLLFSLPVLLNYNLNVWIKYAVELILVGFLAIGLLSKRTEYKNQLLGFIIQGIIVALTLMLPNIIKFQ